MSAAVLYTPKVLALATSLADHPWDPDLPLKGEARSRSCGSTLSLGLSLDAEGRISRVALKPHACAIGQAAAAIFASSAPGRTGPDMVRAQESIAAWLAGDGPLPDWPGLEAIEPAKEYPARHGALLLAWQAARDLLSTTGDPR